MRASKTDPFRQGVSIFLRSTGNDLCPVSAMLAYMTIHGNRSGPMFLFSDGCFLTREGLVSHLHHSLQTSGLNPSSYAGHSRLYIAENTLLSQS